MVLDVPLIDRQHLARHAFVTLVPFLTVREEAFANLFDRQLACIRSITPGGRFCAFGRASAAARVARYWVS